MVSMHPILSILLLSAMGMFFPAPVGAASDRTEKAVVLLYTPPSSLVEDVAAELRAAGFVPVLKVEMPSDPGARTHSSAGGTHRAAVRVQPGDQGIEVHVSDPTRGVSMATEVAGTDAGKRTGAVMAIKAVELLRAALLAAPEERLSSPEPAVGQATDTAEPEVSDAAGKKAARVRQDGTAYFYLAPGATFGHRGLPPMLQVEAMISMRLASRFRLYLFGLLPTFAAEATGNGGGATVRIAAATAGVSADLFDSKRRLQSSVGVECGAFFVSASGVSAIREDEAISRGTAFDLNFRVGLRVRLNRVLFLRSDVLVGAVMPRPTVRVYGEETASVGRPLLNTALGLEVRLF